MPLTNIEQMRNEIIEEGLKEQHDLERFMKCVSRYKRECDRLGEKTEIIPIYKPFAEAIEKYWVDKMTIVINGKSYGPDTFFDKPMMYCGVVFTIKEDLDSVLRHIRGSTLKADSGRGYVYVDENNRDFTNDMATPEAHQAEVRERVKNELFNNRKDR
jgi:hypothetical protein